MGGTSTVVTAGAAVVVSVGAGVPKLGGNGFITNSESETLFDASLKTGMLRPDIIVTHRQSRKPVRTVFGRLGCARQACLDVCRRQRHAGNDPTGRIPDNTPDCRRRQLRVRR